MARYLSVLLIAAAAVADEAEEHLRRGIELHQAFDPEGALEEFTKAIEIRPGWALPYYYRAIVRSALDFDAIRKDLDKAIELDPLMADALVRRGESRAGAGDHDGAIADLTIALHLRPEDVDALRFRSKARAAKRDYPGALADLDRAIECSEPDPFLLAARGDVKREMGDFAGAVGDFEAARSLSAEIQRAAQPAPGGKPTVADELQAVVRAQHDIELLEKIAAAKAGMQDHDGAIAAYDRLIESASAAGGTRLRKAGEYHLNRGISRIAKGDADGALADATKAIELTEPSGTVSTAHVLRGNIESRRGNADAAIAEYGRAIEANLGNDWAYARRAAVRAEKGDLDGALADYASAIEYRPGHAQYYLWRGAVRAQRREYAECEADFSKAIELAPRDGGAWAERGYLRYGTGPLTDALGDLRRSCELDPRNDSYPRLFIFLVRSRLGEQEPAAEELRAYVARMEATPRNEWYRAVSAFLVGDRPEADLLAAAEAGGGESDIRARRCEAFFYAGSLRLLAGDREGAQELLQRCVETGLVAYAEQRAAVAELARLGK